MKVYACGVEKVLFLHSRALLDIYYILHVRKYTFKLYELAMRWTLLETSYERYLNNDLIKINEKSIEFYETLKDINKIRSRVLTIN